MEEKDEFSEIILQRQNDNKASKIKKIILAVSFFILLFIILLLVMKFIYKPDEVNESKVPLLDKEVVNKIDVSPETDDSLYKEVPIIEEKEKKESFDEMVRKIRERENSKATLTKEKEANEKQTKEVKSIPNISSVLLENDDDVIKEVKVIQNSTPQKPEVKHVVKTIIKKQIAKKPVKPVTIKPVKPEKAKEVKKTKIEIPVFPKNIGKPIASQATSGVYIQVLATSVIKPDNSFLNKIKAKNYPYRVYNTVVKDKKYLKILVGPYSNTQEARVALVKVKKDLNPKAFLFFVK